MSHPDRSQFHADPSKLLDAMDQFAAQEDFLISIGSDKRRVATYVLEEHKPKILVELGGYVGYSAISFALIMKRLHGKNNSGVKVLSLEFEPRFAEIAREMIVMAGLPEVVTVVVGAASDSLRTMKADGRLKHIDMLFIDHGEGGIELYESDLKLSMELDLLRSNAIILADNVIRPGAPDYRKFVRSQPGFESKGVPCLIVPGDLEDEMEVTRVL